MTARDTLILDCETDGLRRGRLAWEIAMTRITADGEKNPREFFIDVDLANAEPMALSVGRFYDRHPFGLFLAGKASPPVTNRTDYLSPHDAAAEVARWTHGCQLVAANPVFDLPVLEQLLAGYGLVPGWHYQVRCIESMVEGFLRRPVGGLKRCAEALDVTVNPALEHTAAGDVAVAVALYEAVMNAPLAT
jgi:hypothetical protein